MDCRFYHRGIYMEITKDHILKCSRQCDNKTDFRKNFLREYRKAKELGIYEESVSHMPSRSDLKWTKSKVREEAAKYPTRKKFAKGCESAYKRALKDGYLDEVCEHMMWDNDITWDLDKVKILSEPYYSRWKFQKEENKAYQWAFRNKCLDEVCSHMIPQAPSTRVYDESVKEAMFYILFCYNEFEKFYKVGVTKNTVKERYPKKSAMPYNYRIMLEVVCEPKSVVDIEKFVIEYCQFEGLRHIPKIHFGGEFECFKEIPNEVLKWLKS